MTSRLKSINPATQKQIAEYAETTPQDLDLKLRMAETAFRVWGNTPYSERAARFTSLGKNLRAQQADLAELMTREMGKPITQSHAEIEKCAWVCEYYAAEGERFLQPKEVATEAECSFVRYDPLGAILAIMPWNFPFWQVFRAAVPAIAGGNVMVLKHSGNVCGVALRIEELFIQAEFPVGVFSAVLLSRKRAEQLIEAPAIRGVTLTGSERAGRAVASIAGKHLKPTILELGGSDPFIVLADAELSRVVPPAVKARVQNSGQSCIAAKRFIVHRSLLREFEEAFSSEMQNLRVGDPLQPETQVGPLAREDLQAQLQEQVLKTIYAGGRVRCGGHAIEGLGFFYQPTVLTDVRPGMPAFDEETFGPVAAIIPFDDNSEAVGLANTSSYGLGASVWTADRDAAAEIVPQIAAGAVFINEIVKSDPRLPFGGIKNSGHGRELGREGMLAFLNQKTVWFG